jgi:hypothetical protein
MMATISELDRAQPTQSTDTMPLCDVVFSNWGESSRKIVHKLWRWVFRGQASSKWRLQTAIERSAQIKQKSRHDLPDTERWLLRQFQRRAHLVMSSPPPLVEELEWLSIMQHYGAPTRLLDFTHSFYIATFFAYEFSADDAAVWAANINYLDRLRGYEDSSTLDRNRRSVALAQEVLSGADRGTGVIAVEPERLNERIAIQKGIFLFPLDIRASFEANLLIGTAASDNTVKLSVDQFLAIEPSERPPVVKFVMGKNLRPAVMRDLANMNIDAASLFPGLEGFARSMHRHV